MLSALAPPALAGPRGGSDSGSGSGSGEFRCGDCGRAFGNEHALAQHCRAKGHDPEDSDGSWESGYSDDSDFSDVSDDSDDGARFHCRTCRQGFGTKGALLQHSRAKGH